MCARARVCVNRHRRLPRDAAAGDVNDINILFVFNFTMFYFLFISGCVSWRVSFCCICVFYHNAQYFCILHACCARIKYCMVDGAACSAGCSNQQPYNATPPPACAATRKDNTHEQLQQPPPPHLHDHNFRQAETRNNGLEHQSRNTP